MNLVNFGSKGDTDKNKEYDICLAEFLSCFILVIKDVECWIHDLPPRWKLGEVKKRRKKKKIPCFGCFGLTQH